jgi:hypothetical protein
MEDLPYIDEHSRTIGAPAERVWSALISVVRTDLGRIAPGALTGAMRVEPTRWQGQWRETPRVGDTLPAFAVTESQPPERLALRGRHRFSSYALIFELEQTGSETCVLRAQTRAEFPGLSGRAYRALVIGSQGHRIVVKRLLRNVAQRAKRSI